MNQVAVVLIGIGQVGQALLQQLMGVRDYLAARYALQLELLACVDSSGVLAAPFLNPSRIPELLRAKAAGHTLAELGAQARPWLELLPAQPCVIVDLTAASGMETPLATAVQAGHRVVLANKRPLCADRATFDILTGQAATRYEATVGAGLPVISTLQGLLDSGDRITHIEASLSGTLGFLSSALDDGIALSAAVSDARARGYTEPDPRDDLSGADVARKAQILGRSAGMNWSDSTPVAEPWFPIGMASGETSRFMARLPELDADYQARLARARHHGQVLRYVVSLTQESVRIGWRELEPTHPLAQLRGPDNLIAFYSTRYLEQPLVVRGPGAGAQVTAGAVLADIVASARELRTGLTE